MAFRGEKGDFQLTWVSPQAVFEVQAGLPVPARCWAVGEQCDKPRAQGCPQSDVPRWCLVTVEGGWEWSRTQQGRLMPL